MGKVTDHEELVAILLEKRVHTNESGGKASADADAILDSAWLIKHNEEIIFEAKMEQAVVDGEIVRKTITEWINDYQINLKMRPLVDVVTEDIQNQRR